MKLPLELSKFRLEGRKATMHEEVSGTPVSRVVAPKRVLGTESFGSFVDRKMVESRCGAVV
jgi:hypothetical protein